MKDEVCYQAPRKECVTKNYFSYSSTKVYVVGTQKNRLIEHPRHTFKLMDKKTIAIVHNFVMLNWAYGFANSISAFK